MATLFPSKASLAPQSRHSGIVLCCAVALLAWLIGHTVLAGWLDPLVAAILLGAALRHVLPRAWQIQPGIDACAKAPLELGVVLIGASISAATLGLADLRLAALAALAAGLSFLLTLAIGRLLGLPVRSTILIASGNAICGNSAIVAAAPLIGADRDEIVTSITATATLGVGLVLALPVLGTALALDPHSHGILSGLTAYSVPQVVAAAAPMGADAIQLATVAKVLRILMLVPLVLLLPLAAGHLPGLPSPVSGQTQVQSRALAIPWFVLGFLAMIGLRQLGWFPQAWLPGIAVAAHALMLLAMAALGLSVELRVFLRSGPRLLFASTLSLLGLVALAIVVLAAG